MSDKMSYFLTLTTLGKLQVDPLLRKRLLQLFSQNILQASQAQTSFWFFTIRRERSFIINHRLHTHFKDITNRNMIQTIEGTTIPDVEEKIYKKIYQFIKLFIVTTGRFI